MNNQEAKFILGAYRPDGRDASDPAFAEAKAQAERDPELRAWWEKQRAFDASVSAKLREIAPPSGLRDSILAGVKASQPRRTWWVHPGWLAAAAVVAVLVAVAVSFRTPGVRPSGEQLAAFAVRDLAEAHDGHSGHPPALSAVQARLVSTALPMAKNLAVDLGELRRNNCRTVKLGGRDVFEICFNRDGTWYHLYAASRADFAEGDLEPRALLASRGEYASTVWTDAKNVYALVTRDGVDALRRVI